jgi:hypothetical protein
VLPFLLNASHITYQSRTTLHNIHYAYPYEQSEESLTELAQTSRPHYLASILTTCPLGALPIGLISVTDIKGVYYVNATHAVYAVDFEWDVPYQCLGYTGHGSDIIRVQPRLFYEMTRAAKQFEHRSSRCRRIPKSGHGTQA